MEPAAVAFEQYSSRRLREESDQLTRDWVARVASRLEVDPTRVLPHRTVVDDIPLVLERAADFLLTPDPQRFTGEQLVTDEMRNIARVRLSQGYTAPELMREFDELAHLLDEAALRWVEEYPGDPNPFSVGRVFGRLNRVPLLMGQVTVRVLEQERSELLRRISSAEEGERIRIARELHDQMGQLVTALLLGLRSVDETRERAAPSGSIRELEGLAAQIADEVHRLATDLRPPMLDHLGLGAALESLLQEWGERNDIEVDYQRVGVDGESLPPEVETAIYRIVQEGLTNVARHAGASHVSLVLKRTRGVLSVILEDDGKGFEPTETLVAPEKLKRLGLRGVRERVALLGGTLELESSVGNGTSLFVRLPERWTDDSVDGWDPFE